MSDESSDRPKCDSLADAVREVKFWCGVNMARFTYDPETLTKLFRACCDFESGGEMRQPVQEGEGESMNHTHEMPEHARKRLT